MNDELTLIERSLAGELDAFNQLVLAYQSLAFSVAYRMVRNGDLAADAVQESFIKAFRALDGYRGGNFKSWLMRIVTNTCYDALRSHKRLATDNLDDLPVEEENVLHLIDPAETPHDLAVRKELQALIEDGINSLPLDQRLAVVLCDVEGYSYEEIVELTGATMGTVKSRISRARIKLREYLLASKSELLPAAYRPKST